MLVIIQVVSLGAGETKINKFLKKFLGVGSRRIKQECGMAGPLKAEEYGNVGLKRGSLRVKVEGMQTFR